MDVSHDGIRAVLDGTQHRLSARIPRKGEEKGRHVGSIKPKQRHLALERTLSLDSSSSTTFSTP